jgi:type III secretion protein V
MTGLLSRKRFGGAEVFLAVLVVLVLALMIVPVPTWILDILIGANLSISVAILLVVLFVREPLAIATFPTVLLLTTLFRLALNIASTRLILLQANAGEVIRAFGNFVVRGNFVVGAVVFLILTIIQFVVVAKGAERVAEVGARFTLDAMPGRQMAIDAELRAGSIDGNEAKRRRRSLSRENQFYGAMDGAMKFVKGDVIASIIIVIVNLVGGLAIGVAQRNMEAGAALQRYGILSIGDGLVSQLPSIVLALASGVLVTRVASEEDETPLGEELARQIGGVPKALYVASAFVFLLALVPGLPAVPFLVVAPVFFFAARARTKQMAREEQRAATDPREPRRRDRDEPFIAMVVPWTVEVSSDLEALMDDGVNEDRTERLGFRAMALAVRERLFAELGVPLPPPRVTVGATLGTRKVALYMQEVPTRLVDVPAQLKDDEIVPFVTQSVYELVRRRAADFLGLNEVQRLLDGLEQHAPATVRSVVPKPISLILLTDVLRRLVEEGISIRNLRAILEALATLPPTEKDPLNLAEFVRAQLRRAITFQLTQGSGRLDVYTMDPLIEDTVRRAVQHTPAGSFLTLSPAAARDVITAMRRVLLPPPDGGPTVLISSPEIRRFVRKLIESDLPDVQVISSNELLPDVVLRPVGKVSPYGTA